MKDPALRVVLAGGGTGGHVFPAIAIAEALLRTRPDAEILFIGTRGKIESRVVPAAGFRFATIWVSGFRRGLGWSLVLFPLKVVVAVLQSLLLLRKIRPAVVVGTGGYVSGPPAFAAWLLKIPVLLQEQNTQPGVTTQVLARKAREVHVTFAATRALLPAGTVVKETGNPVRGQVGTADRVESAAAFGLDPARTTVLVFGGSLGATSINNAVLQNLNVVRARGVQVLWQTGAQDVARVRAAVDQEGGAIRVFAFIDRMDQAFAASDLAVCRAGATTLAELALAGLPAILIPYPYAAADHQTSNARAVAEQGAAVFCTDAEAASRLPDMLSDLLDAPARRAAMAQQARRLARPEAATTIANAVLRLAGQTDER